MSVTGSGHNFFQLLRKRFSHLSVNKNKYPYLAMFGTDSTVVLSTYLFEMITKLAREGGSQIIDNVQENNFAREIDDLRKAGEDMFAYVSQQENPTQKAFTV
jgi:hypothetical protein